jgi:4-hydroxy-3-polyprenylbenzoate decarboxylase
MNKSIPKMIIGISGASGFVLAENLLKHLSKLPIETHLVMTKAAQITRQQESSIHLSELKKWVDHYHPIEDIGASIASGSFIHRGMIIVPCSMKTVAEIATGLSSNLLTRAADVTLKERRTLIVVPRETPLHAIHLKNLLTISELGGIIAPPMPAFYQKPTSIDEMVEHFSGRLLGLLGLEQNLSPEWQGWRPTKYNE